MERCHSVLSLPPDFTNKAKYNLVKIARSDGETNMHFRGDAMSISDHHFKSKKRKPNSLSKSIQELRERGDDLVAPSSAGTVKRKITRVPSQDDLWKSIQTNYTFLMADDLIAECKETRKELYLPLPSSSPLTESPKPHHMLTFNEFLDRCNLLHDHMHSLQTSTSNTETDEVQSEQFYTECQYLKEQAALLKLMNPELKEEITRRCNILSNKLTILEKIMFPKRNQEKNEFIKSVTTQTKSIRKWLKEVDGKLRRLKYTDDCGTEEMNEIFSQEKILQREIESRGKELTSIVRQCESLEGATVAETKRLRRAAAHLERSWHNIWIRSLENQCRTEQRLLQRQNYENNLREASDIELDEGPLNKHRRLTLDRWTAVNTTAGMDRVRRDRDGMRSSDVPKSNLRTKDVGVHCSDLVPVNDKCIMVGTTGIAALKAEYGDDFTNFEIIQDVGYSSESSTHLSSDDGISVGGDKYFNIRVYNYNQSLKSHGKCISLKEELENADSKQPNSLASSVGSSSGVMSFNDSGLGASDVLGNDTAEAFNDPPTLFSGILDSCDNFVEDDLLIPGDESDFLETVFKNCVDFSGKDANADEDLQYTLSGVDSDDSADNFHNRSSFTTSSQMFYKMISVDSENDEETRAHETIKADEQQTFTNLESFHADSSTPHKDSSPGEQDTLRVQSFQQHQCLSSDSEQDTFKITKGLSSTNACSKNPSHKQMFQSSTPLLPDDGKLTPNFASPSLKRKRDSDSTDFATVWQGGGGLPPHRVRSWITRCTNYSENVSRHHLRRCLFPSSNSGQTSGDDTTSQNVRSVLASEDLSSCDASGEYTSSSSADEGNPLSSSSSFFEDDVLRLKGRLDSCSADGSIETVIRGLCASRRSDVDLVGLAPLLPPPPSLSTPSCSRRVHCSTESSGCCNGVHCTRNICNDMGWMVFKASSEGDLRNHLGQSTGSDHSTYNTVDKRRKKRMPAKSSYDFKNRLSSSLPNVLHHRSESSTEDGKGSLSNSDNKTHKRFHPHEDSLTSSVLSHNLSSCSEPEKRRRRRSRRKSSSSNRSSRSALDNGDSGRQRSRTLTNSISRCGSRRRHFSQRSDFFEGSENNLLSEEEESFPVVNKSPTEEINFITLKDELELALEDSRNSSNLISPTESDVVLTQLEEQSTVSDQVWDGYQDMPYLSEAYSEATVDEDAVRKLTEFGDDYGSAIGQPLRFLDAVPPSTKSVDSPKSSPKKSSKNLQLQSHNTDSDSDLEDLHHVIEEAERALQFARLTSKRRQAGDFFSSAENAELLATCGTHLHCLQTICEHIEIDGKENNFSSSDLKELYYLVEEWQNFKKSIEMFEETDDPVKLRYYKAQESIDALFNKMSELSAVTENESRNFKTWQELQENIFRLQMVLNTLHDTKEQLLAVNLHVHRFVTEYGDDLNQRDCSLKEEVTELYQRWDDIYEQNGSQLTELESLSIRWKRYNDKFELLNSKLQEVENISSDKNCDNVCLNPEEEIYRDLSAGLQELKCEAESLRLHLKDASSWETLKKELRSLEERVKSYKRTISASRSVDYPNSPSVEDDPDDNFEDAIQHIDTHDATHSKRMTSPHLEGAKKDARNAKKRSSRFWRILRVAVPVQITLVLLFCLACYLEPNCCDRLNNFSFSFTPHLRYLRGPPPV